MFFLYEAIQRKAWDVYMLKRSNSVRHNVGVQYLFYFISFEQKGRFGV